MSKHTGALIGYPSRRDVLRGLAGFMIAISLDGCAQALSSSSATVPTPTPLPHGSVLHTYRGHTDRVTSVAWSPNSKYIVSGSLDQTARIWAVNSSDHIPTYYLPRSYRRCASSGLVTRQSACCLRFHR